MIMRYPTLGLLAVLVQTPAFALTKEEKTATCTFGADHQKLNGAERNTFMTRCLANEDAKPRTARSKARK